MIKVEKAEKIIKNFRNRKILIIGDLILDKYLFGTVDRISPEAPVPIVEVQREELKLGGACNVAWNISKLSGNGYIVGVIGNDENGRKLKKLINNNNINDLTIIDESRPTIEKTRVIAVSQQLIRIDREDRRVISEFTVEKIKENIKKVLNDIEGIIVSDYGKGVVNQHLMDFLTKLGKPIFVDPKPENFNLYKNITIMTPNRKEAYGCIKADKTKSLDFVGKEIMRRLNIKNLLITLSSEGMALFEENNVIKIPAKAKKVFDVTGAGDTVISVLSLAKLSGATWKEAAILSNYAGGYVVGEIGTAAITPEILIEMIKDHRF